jgi:hypothetical protein
MEVSGQIHAPAALPVGKESSAPIGYEEGGPHSQSGNGGEEKKKSCPCLPGIEP